jgi:hypothetical protein
MSTATTLIVFPASLWGGRWAAGPRVKPELVSMFTVLRRAGQRVSVLDLENAVGNPGAQDRDAFMQNVQRQFEGASADLLVISCSSSLQYSASVAVAEIARRKLPKATIAVTGFHVSARPEDFSYAGSPFDIVILGDPELAVAEAAEAVGAGGGRPSSQLQCEGLMLEHTRKNAPEYAFYPYTVPGLPTLPVYLSRGCPYPRAACQLRPGAPGWHAFELETVEAITAELTALKPRRIDVLDPAFGLEPTWRREVLRLWGASEDRREVPVTITVRPDTLVRKDIDLMYQARAHVRFDVETLSVELLRRTGLISDPVRHIDHTVDLLRYANAKGISGEIALVFNQPGETERTAAETLERLGELVSSLPNASLRAHASSWAYYPYGDEEADIEVPRRRFGTRILHPEWWREGIPSERAAKAVIASEELSGREAGDESYWRPTYERISKELIDKLTEVARKGLRSHEWEGSSATGVPHGFWIEPRWH